MNLLPKNVQLIIYRYVHSSDLHDMHIDLIFNTRSIYKQLIMQDKQRHTSDHMFWYYVCVYCDAWFFGYVDFTILEDNGGPIDVRHIFKVKENQKKMRIICCYEDCCTVNSRCSNRVNR